MGSRNERTSLNCQKEDVFTGEGKAQKKFGEVYISEGGGKIYSTKAMKKALIEYATQKGYPKPKRGQQRFVIAVSPAIQIKDGPTVVLLEYVFDLQTAQKRPRGETYPAQPMAATA